MLLVNVAMAASGPPLFLLALIWIVATSITIAARGERATATAPIGIEVPA